ncbi:uncharacterized protein HMPREF1541_02845 [Cyphellophora europaea CBS 101466]|uniref:DNA 3'-5' helicase n=1 Tax=Cyphellophora europaea (strain CBS 101466) TaxID=1220924 RepID=W2S4Q7_CYPE1|nr:uncharacterized protein HMPREF1541_02845 [Cyphellophora europaea CBS 101466]ETN43686.1 hypothetical protein HMPREF1541_02845 [Cyphellophora europaea CBS 101466]
MHQHVYDRGPSQPFKAHYRPRLPESHGVVESSNYFSSPSRYQPNSHVAPSVQVHSHPPLGRETDVMLDDFDKQLLAEIPQDNSVARYDRSRTSLPTPRRLDGGRSRYQFEQAFMDDLHDVSLPIDGHGSSVNDVASSPIVAALQQRRFYQSASHGSRRTTEPSQDVNQFNAYQGPVTASAQSTKRQYSPPAQGQGHSKRRNTRSSTQGDDSMLPLGHPPPVMRGIQLVCTVDLPGKIRTVFPYDVLNAVQSKCYPAAFESDDNLVVSAPTGSGKTAIMELAICRVILASNNQDFKIVYQAPTKSLCSERYQDWDQKFRLLGLDCAELTGDTEGGRLRKVQQASIIITTPEKWDSITRKWRDNKKLVQMIKLFLVDEVHMLKDQRGATLEAVISRMKSFGTSVRFIALSATVPNSDDIATWLGKNSATPEVPAMREVFDESFRPVKLQKHVYGYQYGANDFAFDGVLRKHVSDMIVAHSKSKPTMVFCVTRRSSGQTANDLAAFWTTASPNQRPWPAPNRPILVQDGDLRKVVATGVAFHHGGLCPADRNAVEQGFLQGNISVICSTSTLAVGVNLPCYLVVLQGTMTWSGANGLQSYSDLEVMQMLGRAGRPQFENSACAVILTRDYQVEHYKKMVSGQELLESTLHRNLIEHLNAEIGLGTICDMDSAKRWLSSTFLKVRVRRNPAHYQLEGSGESLDVESLMQHLCEKEIKLLLGVNLIEDIGSIKCTELGEAMARYCVRFETMKTFVAIPPRAKLSEILSILTRAAEFEGIRVRSGEKAFYKELNKRAEIMFPVNVDIALPSHKVSTIIQCELGGASLPDGDNHRKHYQQYTTDKSIIFGHVGRLIRCMIDCQLHLKDAVSVRNVLELAQSLAAKAWDSTPRQLKQLPDIGDVSCRKLASRGINSIEKLLNSEPHQIELALGRAQFFGNKLLNKLANYPQLRVSVKEMGRDTKPGKGANLKLKSEIGFLNEKLPTEFNRSPIYVCFLAEDSEGTVIEFRRFGAQKLGTGEEIFFTAHLDRPITYIRCYVVCDEIVGTRRYAEFVVRDIPHSTFPAGTKPLSTQPKRPVSQNLLTTEHKAGFEDDGIGDEDLLAIPAHGDIDVVDDIDDLLLAAEKSTQAAEGTKVGRKTSMRSATGEQSEWRESTQLPNGRWTCRHSCKEKGVECKHKCCLEGVAKPKNKTGKTAKIVDATDKQQKITSMTSAVRKGSDSQPAPADATQEPAVPAPKQARRINCGTSTEGQMARKALVGGGRRHQLGASGEASNGMPHRAHHEDALDIEEDFCDPMECDWGPSGSTGNFDDAESREAQALALKIDDALRTTHSLEAPIPHVSMQDVQRQPDRPFFVTGQSSSPAKNATPAGPGLDHMDDSQFLADMFADEPSFGKDDEPITGQDAGSARLSTRPAEPDHSSPDKTVCEAAPQEQVYQSTIELFPEETEEQREKRLWEADQKRRWAEFPDWMFKQFGHCAELVD